MDLYIIEQSTKNNNKFCTVYNLCVIVAENKMSTSIPYVHVTERKEYKSH